MQWSSSNPAVATIDGGGMPPCSRPDQHHRGHGEDHHKAAEDLDQATVTGMFPCPAARHQRQRRDRLRPRCPRPMRDSQGRPLGRPGVTISIGTNPPGTGTWTGTLTRATNIPGVARFNDLKIDWLGTGYTLVATANLERWNRLHNFRRLQRTARRRCLSRPRHSGV